MFPPRPVLQAPHSLVMGPAGSGKTSSLATYAKAGIELFVIVTEPTGVDSLYDSWERLSLDLKLLHYSVVPPTSPGWKALLEMVAKSNLMSYKDLSELKSGIGKEQMKQYDKLVRSIANFVDDRTGSSFGDVTSWGSGRAFAIDSLSGWSHIALQNTVGFKPSPHQGEWGIAMGNIHSLLLTLSSDIKCYFTLTAHLEKEPDEITGMARVTVSTLGKKLAPKVPYFFSEVIRARKDGEGKFRWATIDSDSDLKNRALPASREIAQDFAPIIAAHQRRLAASQASSSAAAGSQTIVPLRSLDQQPTDKEKDKPNGV